MLRALADKRKLWPPFPRRENHFTRDQFWQYVFLVWQNTPASADVVYVGAQHLGQVLQSREKLVSIGKMFISEVRNQPSCQLRRTHRRIGHPVVLNLRLNDREFKGHNPNFVKDTQTRLWPLISRNSVYPCLSVGTRPPSSVVITKQCVCRLNLSATRLRSKESCSTTPRETYCSLFRFTVGRPLDYHINYFLCSRFPREYCTLLPQLTNAGAPTVRDDELRTIGLAHNILHGNSRWHCVHTRQVDTKFTRPRSVNRAGEFEIQGWCLGAELWKADRQARSRTRNQASCTLVADRVNISSANTMRLLLSLNIIRSIEEY